MIIWIFGSDPRTIPLVTVTIGCRSYDVHSRKIDLVSQGCQLQVAVRSNSQVVDFDREFVVVDLNAAAPVTTPRNRDHIHPTSQLGPKLHHPDAYRCAAPRRVASP